MAAPRGGRVQRLPRNAVCTCCFIGLMLLGNGCAGQRPLPAWQREVERYIAQQGNGDPNVLRDTVDLRARSTPRPARVTLGKLNVPGPGIWPFCPMRDVNGVLVGQHAIESDNWFLFLVGVTQRPPANNAGLEDIRLLAFASARNRLQWCVAPEAPQAVARYVRTWLPENPEEPGAPPAALTFPADADVFTLEPDGPCLTVTEQRSGATWKLQLPAP